MRSTLAWAIAPRLPIVLGLAAWCLSASAIGQPRSARSDSSPPADSPPQPSASSLLRRLEATPPRKLSRDERALRTGLAFCAAVRKARGQDAFPLIEAIGYQPLPLAGPLPDDPGRPVRPEVVARAIDRLAPATFDVPAGCFRLLDRRKLRGEFPAVARWMLPGDRALVIDPPPRPVAGWVRRRSCLVIRVRGTRTTIMGGNLFAAMR